MPYVASTSTHHDTSCIRGAPPAPKFASLVVPKPLSVCPDSPLSTPCAQAELVKPEKPAAQLKPLPAHTPVPAPENLLPFASVVQESTGKGPVHMSCLKPYAAGLDDSLQCHSTLGEQPSAQCSSHPGGSSRSNAAASASHTSQPPQRSEAGARVKGAAQAVATFPAAAAVLQSAENPAVGVFKTKSGAKHVTRHKPSGLNGPALTRPSKRKASPSPSPMQNAGLQTHMASIDLTASDDDLTALPDNSGKRVRTAAPENVSLQSLESRCHGARGEQQPQGEANQQWSATRSS